MSAVVGTGVIAQAAAAVSGVGAMLIVGVGAVAQTAASVAGSGTETEIGAGSVVQPMMMAIGVGDEIDRGTGSIIQAAASVAGVGLVAGTIVGTGAIIQRRPGVSGKGAVQKLAVIALSQGGGLGLPIQIPRRRPKVRPLEPPAVAMVTGVGAIVQEVASISGVGDSRRTVVRGRGTLKVPEASLDGRGAVDTRRLRMMQLLDMLDKVA